MAIARLGEERLSGVPTLEKRCIFLAFVQIYSKNPWEDHALRMLSASFTGSPDDQRLLQGETPEGDGQRHGVLKKI